MSGRVFRSRTTGLLIGACAFSMVLGLVLSIFQEEFSTIVSSSSDSYSRSALGHRAFVELLDELGISVLSSRYNSSTKASGGTLLVLEPQLQAEPDHRTERFLDMVWSDCDVLIVLPKRRGVADLANRRWLDSVTKVDEVRSQAIFEALDILGTVVQVGAASDQSWTAGSWRGTPEIQACQLIQSDMLEPLLASDEGILLGRLDFSSYWEETLDETEYEETYDTSTLKLLILSDPDLVANHGLSQGENAQLAVQMIDYLSQGTGLIVVDETLHGHELTPSLFRSFFRFPLVLVLLQLVVTLALLLWMAMGRFGSVQEPEPTTGRGLAYLIDNTAELLYFGDHHQYVLTRYLPATVHTVCRRLHLDLPGRSARARTRLLALSQTRDLEFDLKRMEERLKPGAEQSPLRPAQTLEMANEIYRWHEEMTDGL